MIEVFFFKWFNNVREWGSYGYFLDYMYMYMYVIMYKDIKKYLDFKFKKIGIVFIKIIVRIVKEIMLIIKVSFFLFVFNCLFY